MKGFVVESPGAGIAYVKFVDCGTLLREGDAFTGEVKDDKIILTRMPEKELTPEDYAEVDRELDKALPDSLFEEDK